MTNIKKWLVKNYRTFSIYSAIFFSITVLSAVILLSKTNDINFLGLMVLGCSGLIIINIKELK